MKAEHTPGPWIETEIMAFAAGFEITDKDSTILARVMKTSKKEAIPSRANARLISAAPELLEALKAVLQWIDDYAETTGFEAVEAQADAAIAKATGEAV